MRTDPAPDHLPSDAPDVPPGIRLGVVRGITYGLVSPPETIVPQARSVGAEVVRIYLYWSQIEPEPGTYDWSAVDAFLAQLDGDPADSPGSDGGVEAWCDNEPSVPILWAGTAQEYVAQLRVFAAAVRAADPNALVVLGGAPPGAVGSGREVGAVFEHIVANARDDFDVFDVHLYGDPYGIPAAVEACRALMASAGYQKPVVAGEYNGPVPFEFPQQAFAHLGPVVAASGGIIGGGLPEDWTAQTSDRDKLPPEHEALSALYARVGELPPELAMFVPGCPPEAEERRHRWNCRDIVVRNMLALAAGVRRTLCWNLGAELPDPGEGNGLMEFMFDKFKLMDYDESGSGQLRHRYPAADTLALTARMLAGASDVRRHEVPDQPDVYVFEVDRPTGPVLVAWERRDGMSEEDKPALAFDWPWPGSSARAVDAYGAAVDATVTEGRVRLALTITPVIVSA
ncbi:hypothetical protein [Actinopolymorpha pittospori]